MIPEESLALSRFSERSLVQPVLRQFDWDTGWNHVLQIALYQKGPEVSEVGSTWLENLNDMRAVRPFSASEIHALGGKEDFLAPGWLYGAQAGGQPKQIVSLPWTLDTRLIIYRRDLLEQAGVNPAHAFESPEALYATLDALCASGIQYPFSMATGGLTLHNMASFVWGRGGDFRSPDCRKIRLVEPEARRGLVDYFGLHKYIHPDVRGVGYWEADRHYYFNHAAVLMSGQWRMPSIRGRWDELPDEVVENTAYALAPGVPYVGGAHLVIWRHTLHEQEALQLIAYLTSPEVLASIAIASGQLPARLSVLNAPPFANNPDYQLLTESLKRGREFVSTHLWAGVEMRLSSLCAQLWADLFANPDLDLDAEIEKRFRDLAARLEKTLLANW